MIRDFATSSGFRKVAAAWLGGTAPEPAVARPSASLLLVADGASGVETFMLRRQASMAFAAGMYVFPGGGVDPRDAATDLPWAGPGPDDWGTWLGASPAQAAALVCAAVRETFEECGVLLVGPDATSVTGDVSGAGWESDRRALVDHDLALSQLLERRRLVLRSDLLRPWAHWTTPVFEPRRYDTRFFLAALPTGQRARHVAGEASASGWLPASRLLARHADGEVGLMPPTLVCIEEIAAADSVAELLGAARSVVPVMPWVEADGEDLRLRADLPQ